VAEGEQLTAQMMSTNSGLHADLARLHVSETNHDLTAGQLLMQHNHAALRPTKWNEFLPMSMPIVVARYFVSFVVHGACSSGLAAPANCGHEHGRSIPSAEMP
jgi:hypothetical protein